MSVDSRRELLAANFNSRPRALETTPRPTDNIAIASIRQARRPRRLPSTSGVVDHYMADGAASVRELVVARGLDVDE